MVTYFGQNRLLAQVFWVQRFTVQRFRSWLHVIFTIESTNKQKECRTVDLEHGTLNLSTRTSCVQLSCTMQDLLIISTNYRIYELTNSEVCNRNPALITIMVNSKEKGLQR